MARTRKKREIPNIDIGKSYDHLEESVELHIDTLHNLSILFSRDMPPHRHDRYYQIHFLEAGHVELVLGGRSYAGDGPLFFFTPPAVPHSFSFSEKASGVALTLRQDVLSRMIAGSDDAALKSQFSEPVFVQLDTAGGSLTRDAGRLPTLFRLLSEEFYERRPGRRHTLPALAHLVLVSVFRLSQLPERTEPLRRVELEILQSFNELVETRYREHWQLKQYAAALNVTPGRLADICRRLSGMPPKAMVFERQMEEARWQLIYTTTSISRIADKLGFADPAYFCRFFRQHSGESPSQYRQRALGA